MNSLVCFPEGVFFTSVKCVPIETKSSDAVKKELSSLDLHIHVLCVLWCVPVNQNTNSFSPGHMFIENNKNYVQCYGGREGAEITIYRGLGGRGCYPVQEFKINKWWIKGHPFGLHIVLEIQVSGQGGTVFREVFLQEQKRKLDEPPAWVDW